jgi:hypothetical protein
VSGPIIRTDSCAIGKIQQQTNMWLSTNVTTGTHVVSLYINDLYNTNTLKIGTARIHTMTDLATGS